MIEQELKLRKKQEANIEFRKNYKRPPNVYKYESIVEDSNADMTTQVKTSRNPTYGRRGAKSTMDNPYDNSDVQSKNYTIDEPSTYRHKRKSLPQETIERTEKFSYQKQLEQRSNRVK